MFLEYWWRPGGKSFIALFKQVLKQLNIWSKLQYVFTIIFDRLIMLAIAQLDLWIAKTTLAKFNLVNGEA
jgi:hypothetical protein